MQNAAIVVRKGGSFLGQPPGKRLDLTANGNRNAIKN
jgi:hypothetical protein